MLLSGLMMIVSQTMAKQTNDAGISFPDISESHLKDIHRYDINEIAHLDLGLNKDQIRHLLGNPHFSEGLFFERIWNYVLDIRIPETEQYQRCQLRIDYDTDYKAERYSWLGNECQQLTQGQKKINNQELAELPEVIELSADALFSYNGSQTTDLLPEGLTELRNLANSLNDSYSKIHKITVTGHTDRIGSETYNYNLGLQRAETVKQIFIQNGVSELIIEAKSLGEVQPKTNYCNFTKKVALIECLQPDRRVVIEISAERK